MDRYISDTIRYNYSPSYVLRPRIGTIKKIKEEDASGGEAYYYGRQGEVAKTVRTVMASVADIRTYVYGATYDSWNRVRTKACPDDGVVICHCDANGNMTEDFNKKISKIEYNLLNLPSKLQLSFGHMAEYSYDGVGRKLSVTCKTSKTNLFVPMGSIFPPQSADVALTLKTDYCGNMIYENGQLSKILTGVGYITLANGTPTYHYYLEDHLGNNRVVIDEHGKVEQVNHYYAFGGLMAESTDGGTQPYKYNGKELDRMHGLDWYDYGARHYDAALGRWMCVDPLAEKYQAIGGYVYCAGNPVRFLDLNGKEPGDFFESMNLAAIDFGKYYNASSIKENREYATLIYETKDRWGNIAYSYNTPLKGTKDSSKPSMDGLPGSAIVRAIAHTHGEDLGNYDNENFSPTDIEAYKHFDGYVVTPKGKLKHYNHITKKQNIVATKRLPYSLKKGSNGRTKVIGNVYYHKKGFKTATERRVAWYKNKMKESWYDRHISSTLHPIEKVSKQ